jgi:hypothetical protein
MAQRWNPALAAAWGACVGSMTIAIELTGSWNSPFQIFEILGGAFAASAIFGAAAAIRNVLVRAR